MSRTSLVATQHARRAEVESAFGINLSMTGTAWRVLRLRRAAHRRQLAWARGVTGARELALRLWARLERAEYALLIADPAAFNAYAETYESETVRDA